MSNQVETDVLKSQDVISMFEQLGLEEQIKVLNYAHQRLFPGLGLTVTGFPHKLTDSDIEQMVTIDSSDMARFLRRAAEKIEHKFTHNS